MKTKAPNYRNFYEEGCSYSFLSLLYKVDDAFLKSSKDFINSALPGSGRGFFQRLLLK